MICKRLPCQVGGGLKTAGDGKVLLEAGAKRVIYGSSLFGAAEAGEARRHKLIRLEFAEELKGTLGEEALVFSVDTKAGKVAVKGWKDSVDLTPEEAITWLEDSCAAFLYTHVDTEGTMQGFPIEYSRNPASLHRKTTHRSRRHQAAKRNRRTRRDGSRRRCRNGRLLRRHERLDSIRCGCITVGSGALPNQ